MERVYGRRLSGFGSLASSAAQPYGPEHAYRSSRVRTIETRIDPAIPIPFEKNTNILQANSRVAEIVPELAKLSQSPRADAGIRFDETMKRRTDRRIVLIAPRATINATTARGQRR